jgi:hypothetical protein
MDRKIRLGLVQLGPHLTGLLRQLTLPLNLLELVHIGDWDSMLFHHWLDSEHDVPETAFISICIIWKDPAISYLIDHFVLLRLYQVDIVFTRSRNKWLTCP